MSKRAIRRLHARRMKKRARAIWPGWPAAIKRAEHLKSCSCPMCCNARRNPWNSGRERLSLQERRHLDAAGGEERKPG